MTSFLGGDATARRFKELPLSNFNVLHLALHGYVDASYPDQSALVFAPEHKNLYESMLRVRQIRNLHLDARLVTLSACDTGVGPVGEEGVDNIVNAFIEAGADSVVSTLWELEDHTTEHLMAEFYARLGKGESKGEALRDAQRELIKEGVKPYYWASFELVWEAVRTELVFRSDDSYRFLHDRVQEAAYSMIPQQLRPAAHLRIGMLLAEHTPEAKREELIFEIVNQLNRGSHLLISVEDRERVAELNLIAGRRAKVSTAYASALKYLGAGRALLTEETWERNYSLIFSTEYLMAECELLTADKVAAESRLSLLPQRANNRHDFCIATRLRLTLYTTLDRCDRAVDVFLEWLRSQGTVWSNRPTRDDVLREYERIWALLGSRQIEELMDLPLVVDPEVLDSCLAMSYVRKDFLDGRNLYGWKAGYKRFVASKMWHSGMEPEAARGFLSEYGWDLIEDVGYDHLARRYPALSHRGLAATPVERMVYAEKQQR